MDSQPAPAGGSGGGGTADGGDGGPAAADDCAGLAPASLGTMASYAEDFDPGSGICGLPVGNGSGAIALRVGRDHGVRFTLLHPSGGVSDHLSPIAGGISPLPDGFLYWALSSFRGTAAVWSMSAIDDSGRARAASTFAIDSPGEQVFAADVNGGMVAAGSIVAYQQPKQRRVMMFDPAGAVRWGPFTLPADGAIFGLGVSLDRRVLVIQDGIARCGAGCVVAQWFDAPGAASGAFTLLTGFSPGPATWFETAPLIGGGLAVRRVDADGTDRTEGFQSQWMGTVESGKETLQAAPDWMKARPDTNLALARGGSAYAILPNGAPNRDCTQDLELVSSSGKSCAKWPLPLAANGTCDTLDLRLGLDGTILQRLPIQLETGHGQTRTCTLRFWPAALH